MANCRIYKDLKNCSECLQGYFVQNNKCEKVTLIDNCLNYNGVSGFCEECNSDFYLDTSTQNLCVQRVQSLNIKNCEIKKISHDSCSQCVQNFQLFQNDSLCVNKINNCASYSLFGVDDEGNNQYKCDGCLSHYYLDSLFQGGIGQCNKGTISNCLNYKLDKNECLECEFMYYLQSSTECVQSTFDNISSNCVQTDSSKPNTCLKCEQNYILINRITECQLAQPFENFTNVKENKCTEWQNPTECISCEPMFYGKQCENETG